MRRSAELSKETNVFKLYLSDVGLLTSCYPLSVKRELLEMNPEREINNGALRGCIGTTGKYIYPEV